ncbi:MAG: hypothetical protein HUJ31_13840, partial [Pseudomonadales bacterium]|nr:hypothetical protein [Pseudomonadales bacterium]
SKAPVLANVDIPDRELIQPVDLIGAAKVTGQYGRFRYGVMTAFEDDYKLDATIDGQPFNLQREGSNYGVGRLFFEDSPGGAYRAFGILSTAVMHPDGDAVAHGVDGHYLGSDGKWKIDGQAFTSDIDGQERGYGGFLDFEYTPRQGVSQRMGVEYFDEHVDINDLGYLQRNDNFRFRSSHIRNSSNLSWARDNEFDVRGFVQKNLTEDLFTGGGIFFSNRTVFNNLRRFVVRLNFFAEHYDDLNSFNNGTYRVEESASFGMGTFSDPTREFSWGGGAGTFEENLGGRSWNANLDFNWRPNDRFKFALHIGYEDRDGWLLHQEDLNFTTFQSQFWTPRIEMDYFINAKQQFQFSLQWIGIKAEEDEFYLIPATPGDLIPTTKPVGPSDSFAISQLSFQLRYRWEIAPLSDIFVVYTRTADHATRLGSQDFAEIYRSGFANPLPDLLVFKIRYRFGS